VNLSLRGAAPSQQTLLQSATVAPCALTPCRLIGQGFPTISLSCAVGDTARCRRAAAHRRQARHGRGAMSRASAPSLWAPTVLGARDICRRPLAGNRPRGHNRRAGDFKDFVRNLGARNLHPLRVPAVRQTSAPSSRACVPVRGAVFSWRKTAREPPPLAKTAHHHRPGTAISRALAPSRPQRLAPQRHTKERPRHAAGVD
jgi:hypothetical protein